MSALARTVRLTKKMVSLIGLASDDRTPKEEARTAAVQLAKLLAKKLPEREPEPEPDPEPDFSWWRERPWPSASHPRYYDHGPSEDYVADYTENGTRVRIHR